MNETRRNVKLDDASTLETDLDDVKTLDETMRKVKMAEASTLETVLDFVCPAEGRSTFSIRDKINAMEALNEMLNEEFSAADHLVKKINTLQNFED